MNDEVIDNLELIDQNPSRKLMKDDEAENRYVRDQEERLNLDKPSNYQLDSEELDVPMKTEVEELFSRTLKLCYVPILLKRCGRWDSLNTNHPIKRNKEIVADNLEAERKELYPKNKERQSQLNLVLNQDQNELSILNEPNSILNSTSYSKERLMIEKTEEHLPNETFWKD
jgi:hypothetical protein